MIPAFFYFSFFLSFTKTHTTKLHLMAFYVLDNYDSISLLSDLFFTTSIEMFFFDFVMPGYGFGLCFLVF